MRILITGAAGNLGGMLARHLLTQTQHFLNLLEPISKPQMTPQRHRIPQSHRDSLVGTPSVVLWRFCGSVVWTGVLKQLLVHRAPVSEDLVVEGRTHVYRGDLADDTTLIEPCSSSDAIVHFAGVLFAPTPEKFLPITNTLYTKHLVDAAAKTGVKTVILISFPHVEGSTSKGDPCTGRQDRQPVSVHAQTRLAAERYLVERARETGLRAIVLRPGTIYGRDVLMVRFAKWLAERKLLGVWREPTPIHVLSIEDFNVCCRVAIERPDVQGIYPLGDDAPTTLQEFLDTVCVRWELGKPWRVPVWSVYTVAWLCETAARLFRTQTPFTIDFIRIGRVPYFCDTHRMKAELLPMLQYPTLQEGLVLL